MWNILKTTWNIFSSQDLWGDQHLEEELLQAAMQYSQQQRDVSEDLDWGDIPDEELISVGEDLCKPSGKGKGRGKGLSNRFRLQPSTPFINKQFKGKVSKNPKKHLPTPVFTTFATTWGRNPLGKRLNIPKPGDQGWFDWLRQNGGYKYYYDYYGKKFKFPK